MFDARAGDKGGKKRLDERIARAAKKHGKKLEARGAAKGKAGGGGGKSRPPKQNKKKNKR